eukprot:GHVS01098334.1.p1 GENE.GHVS01098334.1~~GHVS01098334.1.p1  ORF type:complete len:371 (-),score=76.53 GHVS01098334.1:481-1593(-)
MSTGSPHMTVDMPQLFCVVMKRKKDVGIISLSLCPCVVVSDSWIDRFFILDGFCLCYYPLTSCQLSTTTPTSHTTTPTFKEARTTTTTTTEREDLEECSLERSLGGYPLIRTPVELQQSYEPPRGILNISANTIIWTPHAYFTGVPLVIAIFHHKSGLSCLRTFQSALSAFSSAEHPKFVFSCPSHLYRCSWTLTLHAVVARARAEQQDVPGGGCGALPPLLPGHLLHSFSPSSLVTSCISPLRSTTSSSPPPPTPLRRSPSFAQSAPSVSPRSLVHSASCPKTIDASGTRQLLSPHHKLIHFVPHPLHYRLCQVDGPPSQESPSPLRPLQLYDSPRRHNTASTLPIFYRLDTAEAEQQENIMQEPNLFH